MTRDAKSSGLGPAILAGAVAGAFGSWQWVFFAEQFGLRAFFRL
jgi:hypothetical protein